MPRRGLTQEKVLAEGTQLIVEKGPEQFSVRELASRLGVKPASLYNHMESAADLTEQIGRRALERLAKMLEDTDAGSDPKSCLVKKALAYRRFALEQPHLYRTILKIPSQGSLELQNQGRSLYATIYPLLERLQVPKEDHIHFCRALRSAMHGFISLEAAGFFSREVDVEASYAYMVNIVIGGLLK